MANNHCHLISVVKPLAFTDEQERRRTSAAMEEAVKAFHFTELLSCSVACQSACRPFDYKDVIEITDSEPRGEYV